MTSSQAPRPFRWLLPRGRPDSTRAGGRAHPSRNHPSELFLIVGLVALFLAPGVLLVVPSGPTSTFGAGSSSEVKPAITFTGVLNVSTSLAYSNTTLSLLGGILIEPGGTLHLSDVVLNLTELSDLATGIEVQKGGTLNASGLTIQSTLASNHWWILADAGSVLSVNGGHFTGLGGTSRPGVDLQTSGARLTGVTFDQYYSAVKVEGASAVLSHCTFLNSTSSSPSTYIVSDLGSGTGLQLTGSVFRTMANVGALSIAVGNALIEGNTFQLNSSGTNTNPIWLGYSGHGSPNAAGSRFLDNHVDGADVGDIVAPNINISGNVVNDPGPHRNFGIHASVTIGTSPGLWIRNLTIDHNVVSNYTYFGIRVEQNVTQFHLDGNSILPPREPQPAGVPQPNGVYAIRSVNNGTIDDNYIDMSVGPTLASIGICLESNTSDIAIRGNVVLNATQNALNIQGNDGHFDSATWYEDGASDRNVVEDNQFLNYVTNRQTTFMIVAVVLWQWANYTTVVNNTFLGWGNVSGVSITYDGAAVLTSCSYGTFAGNRIIDATFGFVFRNFGSVKLAGVGTYNRSANLVYGNALYGISKTAVVQDSSDNMGPIANVIDVLWNTSMATRAPSSYLESIRSATELGGWSGNGTYGLTLRTVDPVTGLPGTFSTYLRWSSPSFGLSVLGPSLGNGTLDFPAPVANSSTLSYSLPSASALSHSFCLGRQNANYSVGYSTSGGSTTSLTVTAPNGTATFGTTSNGQVNVSASLSGATSTTGGAGCLAGRGAPSGGGGGSASAYAVSGTVANASGGTAIAGATVQVSGGGTATTNALGIYRLSLANGSYSLTANASGFAPETTLVTVVGVAVTQGFALTALAGNVSNGSGGSPSPTAFVVDGTVTDSVTGTPLTGVALALPDGTRVKTNTNGTYLFAVSNWSFTISAKKPGYLSQSVPVTVNGSSVHENISLVAHAYRLSGKVTVGSTGAPLELVNLSVESTTLWQSTNASGDYSLLVPNGTYTIRLSKTGYVPVHETITITGTPTDQNFTVELTPPSSASPPFTGRPASSTAVALAGAGLLVALAGVGALLRGMGRRRRPPGSADGRAGLSAVDRPAQSRPRAVRSPPSPARSVSNGPARSATGNARRR